MENVLMAATQFRLAGHAATVFGYLRRRRGEWCSSIAVARSIGITTGQASPAIQTLARNHYIIMRRQPNSRERLWLRAVDSPGKPSCNTCGAMLPRHRKVTCPVCLPYDPSLPQWDVQPGSEHKINILAERYAQGLPPFIEQGQRNYNAPTGRGL